MTYNTSLLKVYLFSLGKYSTTILFLESSTKYGLINGERPEKRRGKKEREG